MGPQEAPEELTFDFGDLADASEREGGGRRRRQVDDDAASVLRRRVEEVSAVAHARTSRLRPTQAALVSDVVEAASTVVEAPGASGNRPASSTPGEGPWPLDEVGPEGDDLAREADEPLADGRSSDGALTIAGFYDRLRGALSRAFPGEWWVTGEIRDLRESRGHRYLELADEGIGLRGRAPAQQLEVVCWAREWPPVAAALAEAGVSLEVGRVVRVRGRVSVWEGGSRLRFSLSAIDVDALLGGIAAARHRLLRALAAEDLLEANARLGFPLVPLRVGVVTSPGSEAHRDFLGQLRASGYAFEVLLEPSLVQGAEAPIQIAAALGRLARREPDLAVVVRGGGARGDLAAFDSEEVARAIATAPFPVWTGVGHTGDRSVADEVAQRACITPTACGQAVVEIVDAYVARVSEIAGQLSGLARARLDGAAGEVERSRAAAARAVRHQLDRRADLLVGAAGRLGRSAEGRLGAAEGRLAHAAERLAAGVKRGLTREEREVHRCRQVLRAYDPRRQLERGWSLTYDASGRLVRTCAGLEVGAALTTRLVDGEVRSIVEGVALTSPGPTGRPAAGEEGEGDG